VGVARAEIALPVDPQPERSAGPSTEGPRNCVAFGFLASTIAGETSINARKRIERRRIVWVMGASSMVDRVTRSY
jgi:hypothetical protein